MLTDFFSEEEIKLHCRQIIHLLRESGHYQNISKNNADTMYGGFSLPSVDATIQQITKDSEILCEILKQNPNCIYKFDSYFPFNGTIKLSKILTNWKIFFAIAAIRYAKAMFGMNDTKTRELVKNFCDIFDLKSL